MENCEYRRDSKPVEALNDYGCLKRANMKVLVIM